MKLSKYSKTLLSTLAIQHSKYLIYQGLKRRMAVLENKS